MPVQLIREKTWILSPLSHQAYTEVVPDWEVAQVMQHYKHSEKRAIAQNSRWEMRNILGIDVKEYTSKTIIGSFDVLQPNGRRQETILDEFPKLNVGSTNMVYSGCSPSWVSFI